MIPRSFVYGLASTVTLFALAGLAARADIDPGGPTPGTPLSVTSNGDGTWTWTYDVELTNTEVLQSGDFFTFYDFNGFAGSASGPTGYTPSYQLVGPSPVVGATTSVTPTDSPSAWNITFTYNESQTGPGPLSLGHFSILSYEGNSSTTLEAFAARATENFPSATPPYPKNANGTQYTAPAAVPEPGEMAFVATFGMGLLGLLGRARAFRRYGFTS